MKLEAALKLLGPFLHIDQSDASGRRIRRGRVEAPAVVADLQLCVALSAHHANPDACSGRMLERVVEGFLCNAVQSILNRRRQRLIANC